MTKLSFTVQTTPAWKVKAIAKYKQQQRNKNKLMSNSLQTTLSSSSSSQKKPVETTPNFRQLTTEIVKLRKEESDLKNEINSLAVTKTSLLWLLKKAKAHDTYLNHSNT